jgi:cyclophilin family peptidyl-prolyl cis-trans isomerase
MNKKSLFTIIILLTIVSIITGCTKGNTEDKMVNTNRHAIIETSMGTIEVELYEDKAPNTTANFIKLSEKGFYNNVIFHRVIPNFMVQTGDPRGDGTGGPGYAIKDEFGPGLKHNQSGRLSMANSGPNTGGSQFFITTVPTPWLDGKHAIFGQVIKGQDVVDKISMVQRDRNDKPLTPILIKKITIK